MKAIITGGTGFVGANLVRRLLQQGDEVHLLVRPGYAPERIADILSDVRLHVVSLADTDGVQQTVASIHPERVFHCAVYGAYSWQNDAREMIATNVLGTANLLLASLDAGCGVFVNTGSSSEYGYKDHAPQEDEAVEPNSYYSVTKVSATMFCRYTAQRTGACIPTLRLYSAYGPYEDPNRLIPKLIQHGLQGTYPPLANPDIARDYVYIDDVIDAYLLAAETEVEEKGGIYNVGTGVQTTLREIVGIVRRIMNIPAEPEWGTMESRNWDTTVWVSNTAKIRRELGWEPRFGLEDGFRRMVEWEKRRVE